ncbi:uncharacterized protein [Solanum lycopersicum]|uniref:uncharacterized protein n=1 Tax=Solanum lycopersicum TaxID=4081 RepID=UPI0008FEC8A5|nr:uncharacterized protein LOC104648157 [Solanum lycopersicum]XP_019069703.1 uncharacterized protein LOC104648157 [Solanum lycopersicum]
MLLSRGHNGKRIFLNAAFENFEQRNHPSIEIFNNKFLLEVFKRLPSGKETSVCACVSKRWLTLLCTVHKDEIAESNGYLARSLLVAIVVRTSNRGDLTKLSIRGNNLRHSVTYIGLKDISRGSPTLKEHSLWNVSYVGDEGLSQSARECHLSEKLDLFQCPRNRGPDCSSSLERKILDVVNECRMTNSSMTHPCDPNLVPSWKRSFDILGALKFVPWMLNSFIQAHPPSRVRLKVYEFSRILPDTLKFELVPHEDIWESLFNNHIPSKEDIGVYFFASEKERFERYIALVKSICSKDLVMRTLINDDELLILASTALGNDSQNIA